MATTVAVAVPFQSQKPVTAAATIGTSTALIEPSAPTPAAPITAQASAVPTTNDEALKTVLISGRPRRLCAIATDRPASGNKYDQGNSSNATASIASANVTDS